MIEEEIDCDRGHSYKDGNKWREDSHARGSVAAFGIWPSKAMWAWKVCSINRFGEESEDDYGKQDFEDSSTNA